MQHQTLLSNAAGAIERAADLEPKTKAPSALKPAHAAENNALAALVEQLGRSGTLRPLIGFWASNRVDYMARAHFAKLPKFPAFRKSVGLSAPLMKPSVRGLRVQFLDYDLEVSIFGIEF